jgi:hypothetical protein
MSNFELKVNSITTVNAPNIKLGSENFVNDDSLLIKAIRCACYILNLIVQVCFEDSSMSNCNKKIWYYCKRAHASLLIRQILSEQTFIT